MTSWMKILTELHLLKEHYKSLLVGKLKGQAPKDIKELCSRKFNAIPSFFPITVLRIYMAEVYVQSFVGFFAQQRDRRGEQMWYSRRDYSNNLMAAQGQL